MDLSQKLALNVFRLQFVLLVESQSLEQLVGQKQEAALVSNSLPLPRPDNLKPCLTLPTLLCLVTPTLLTCGSGGLYST